MPFGVDALVIYLAARNEGLFWLYPLLATAGSLAGAAATFWIGHKAGDMGLPRLMSSRQLERLRSRARHRGAAALALPALFPPPFPLTPLVLTCGALHVNAWWFLPAFGLVRLVRFSAGAFLGRLYGPSILRFLDGDTARIIVFGFISVAVAGTLVSAVLLWRNAHARALGAA